MPIYMRMLRSAKTRLYAMPTVAVSAFTLFLVAEDDGEDGGEILVGYRARLGNVKLAGKTLIIRRLQSGRHAIYIYEEPVWAMMGEICLEGDRRRGRERCSRFMRSYFYFLAILYYTPRMRRAASPGELPRRHADALSPARGGR